MWNVIFITSYYYEHDGYEKKFRTKWNRKNNNYANILFYIQLYIFFLIYLQIYIDKNVDVNPWHKGSREQRPTELLLQCDSTEDHMISTALFTQP